MLSYKDIETLHSERTDSRKLCSHCGHSMLLGRKDKKPCSHCGWYVFKDKATEFQYRMKEKLLKEKKENDTNNNI